jgi:hypothetical protein
MDPITLIVAAVVAGASAGVTDAVTDAVKDQVTRAYNALRTKLVERFSGNATVGVLVESLENDPASAVKKSALTQTLGKEQIADDDELVALAQSVTTASGLDVEQITELARGATVLRSGQLIEGVTSQTVSQKRTLGENARIDDSPMTIRFGPSQG